MSTRRVTNQQFSNRTTIDGNRLDSAFSDVVDAANTVKRGDVARRYVQSQIAMGWTPSTGNNTYTASLLPNQSQQDSLPFMPVYNDIAGYIAGATPEQGVQNQWRHKGTYNTGVDPTQDVPDTIADRQTVLAWTTAIKFTRSVILTGLHLDLYCPANDDPGIIPPFLNDFIYGTNAPKGKALGQPLNDVVLIVMVDDPFLPEDARLANMEIHKYDWKVDSGLPVNEHALNVPVPEGARVRFAICIPFYQPQDYGAIEPGKVIQYWDGTGWTNNVGFGVASLYNPVYGVPPWANQVYSSTLTFLEPCEG